MQWVAVGRRYVENEFAHQHGKVPRIEVRHVLPWNGGPTAELLPLLERELIALGTNFELITLMLLG